MNEIFIEPLTQENFAPYGDVLEIGAGDVLSINQGNCDRHHDLAKLSFGEGQAGISIFNARLRELPYELDLMERHPLGSQAFIPMCQNGFLILVADDDEGKPVNPRAFVSAAGQGVNLYPNTWHGVLTPLSGSGMFCVIDRIGVGDNLQEYPLERHFVVKRRKAET